MSKFLLAALAILAISADAKKKKPKKELELQNIVMVRGKPMPEGMERYTEVQFTVEAVIPLEGLKSKCKTWVDTKFYAQNFDWDWGIDDCDGLVAFDAKAKLNVKNIGKKNPILIRYVSLVFLPDGRVANCDKDGTDVRLLPGEDADLTCTS